MKMEMGKGEGRGVKRSWLLIKKDRKALGKRKEGEDAGRRTKWRGRKGAEDEEDAEEWRGKGVGRSKGRVKAEVVGNEVRGREKGRKGCEVEEGEEEGRGEGKGRRKRTEKVEVEGKGSKGEGLIRTP